MALKSTEQIRKLLNNAKIDFEIVENNALNAFLPKIFLTCPFTNDICEKRQCIKCPTLKETAKKITDDCTHSIEKGKD